jgi:Xaa-Pro aminopeptidase
MPRFPALFLAAVLASAALAQQPRPFDEYHTRRVALQKALGEGVTVLFGNTEKDVDDARTAFYQEPNFFYLTGWSQPGAILLLMPPGDNGGFPGEILFLPRHNPEHEKWTGRKAAADDENIREVTGFSNVMAAETFEMQVAKALQFASRVNTPLDRPAAAKLQTLLPLREFHNTELDIARLRMKKSPYEIELIQQSIDATLAAHRAAWKLARPGVYEYQIAAAMTGITADQGCERQAYAPIVGSGPNAAVLHYSENSRRMEDGDLLLMDVGAECSAYDADITRTVPVSGKFSKRQREIYEIVLGAQKAAIAAIKPGMTIGKATPGSIYKIAYDYIDSHGKDLHGDSLGKYFIHGIGHHVGLEVHDANDPAAPLEAGDVITIEPGIYIPEEKIGIRIEDMALVTATGSKLLSEALPREAGAIEKGMGR